MSAATPFADGGIFFEGPRWHDGKWWVSDFFGPTVSTFTTDGERETVLEVEGQPSGLGWMPDGSLLVVSMMDMKVLRRTPDGEVSVHADISEFCGGWANDMVVDARGHAYVGNFGYDMESGGPPPTTTVTHVAPDGTASVGADGLIFPNGSVITPDGKTLIVGESAGSRYTAFTIGEDGSLSDQRVWAQVVDPPELKPLYEMLGEMTFAPDGCTLDAEGHIWCADFAGVRCARVAEGGEIVDEISLPDGLQPFACMLGGDDGRTLLICAGPGLQTFETRAPDGVLLTATVDVPHAGLP